MTFFHRTDGDTNNRQGVLDTLTGREASPHDNDFKRSLSRQRRAKLLCAFNADNWSERDQCLSSKLSAIA